MKLLRYAWGLPVAAIIFWSATEVQSKKWELRPWNLRRQYQSSPLTWEQVVNQSILNLSTENDALKKEIGALWGELAQQRRTQALTGKWCRNFSADVERQFKERKDWGEQVENTLTQLRYECRD